MAKKLGNGFVLLTHEEGQAAAQELIDSKPPDYDWMADCVQTISRPRRQTPVPPTPAAPSTRPSATGQGPTRRVKKR